MRCSFLLQSWPSNGLLKRTKVDSWYGFYPTFRLTVSPSSCRLPRSLQHGEQHSTTGSRAADWASNGAEDDAYKKPWASLQSGWRRSPATVWLPAAKGMMLFRSTHQNFDGMAKQSCWQQHFNFVDLPPRSTPNLLTANEHDERQKQLTTKRKRFKVDSSSRTLSRSDFRQRNREDDPWKLNNNVQQTSPRGFNYLKGIFEIQRALI